MVFLRRLGFGIGVTAGGLFGLFVIGETMSDPGGWAGIGLIALWVVPLTAAILLGWYRPRAAARVFTAVIAAVTGLSVWFAADPGAWRSFEDRHGPVRAIAVFALTLALVVYGLRRTALAGAMLLFLGVVPVAIARTGHGGFGSLAAAATLPVIVGLLYLASTVLVHPAEPTGTAQAARFVIRPNPHDGHDPAQHAARPHP